MFWWVKEMKRDFEHIVDDVLQSHKVATQEDRNSIVNEICEAYVMEHDKKPEPYQLTRLANLVLDDDIRNPDSYKVQKEEYPFHSDLQTKRRKRKEFVALDNTLEFMSYKVKARLSTAPTKDNNL